MSARCATLLIAAATASCASMIKPQRINPVVYDSFSCEQIEQERTTLTAALKAAGGLQSTSIISVIGSVFALGGAPDISGGWHGSQIANFKGRLIALDDVATRKECTSKKDTPQ